MRLIKHNVRFHRCTSVNRYAYIVYQKRLCQKHQPSIEVRGALTSKMLIKRSQEHPLKISTFRFNRSYAEADRRSPVMKPAAAYTANESQLVSTKPRRRLNVTYRREQDGNDDKENIRSVSHGCVLWIWFHEEAVRGYILWYQERGVTVLWLR